MKKILFSLALMSALLVSCEPENGEDNQEPTPNPEYSISISPTELTFGAEGGEQSVTVTAKYGDDDAQWEIYGGSDWCEVSAYYGESGDKISFSADPYENTAEERTATFTFSCGDKDVELIVTQGAKVYSISVEPEELSFEVEGGEQTITVTSSDDWEISEKPDWITLSERYGETGAVITVSAKYNYEADVRSGEIVLSCGDKDAKVSVTQQPDNSPIIQFKDPYFLDALLETYSVELKTIKYDVNYDVNVDKNNDGQISEKEAASVEVLNLHQAEYQSGNDIRNADELKYFTSLKYLWLYSNSQLTSIDLSGCTALEYLNCSFNQLTSLDLSNNKALTELRCDYNELLTSIDLSGCTALEYLNCSSSQLTSLDLSSNTALTDLDCSYNQLTSLDLSKNTALTELDCRANELTSLDLSGCTALTELDCRANELTSLDLSGCTALTDLDCNSNELTSLNVSGCTALTELMCYNNPLTTLDVSGCTALTDLDCNSNELTSLNVSGCTALKYLKCSNNGITDIDLSNNRQLIIFMPVSYEYDYSYNLELGTVNASSKCPLKSLKIYKYSTIEQCVFDALDIAYPDLKIEYVE